MSERHDVYVVIQEELTNEEALAGKAGKMIWFSVDHFDSLEDAEEEVELIGEQIYHRTGSYPQRLDD